MLIRPFLGQRGKQSPIIYHLISSSDLPYPVPLLGWCINHTSTQGPPEPISNQLALSWVEQSPEIYHLLSTSDSSYPVPLLEWYNTQLSPQRPPLRVIVERRIILECYRVEESNR